MNLEDFTPFTPTAFVSAKDGIRYVMTVLVKAAFGMRNGEVVQPLEAQLFPLGDAYPEGVDPTGSSLAYASDFAPYKLRADVLLRATAYRPAEQPLGSFPIAFRIGDLVKQLIVSSPRDFKHGLISSSIVEHEPLAALPITYENSFGGPKYGPNPVGMGYKSDALPLIEDPNQRVRTPGDKPSPAGLGPIAPDWEPRKSMVGTPGPDYLEKHWPGYPGDFDERFFNAAPADQQVEGYLRGDEVIVLENLHPTHPLYATQLPAWRVVCLRESDDGKCDLIPLVIDTLWISPDDEQLVLLWRGRMSVQTPDALEVKRLGFMVESLAAPPRDAAYYQGQLQTLIGERDAEFEPEPPPVEAESEAATLATDETPAPNDESEDAEEAQLLQIKTQVAAIRAKAGHPPEEEITPTEPPPLSPEAQAKYDEIMAKMEEEDRLQAAEEVAKRWTREKVVAAINAKQPFVDADLSNLDLSGGDFADADFRGAKLSGADFTRAVLSRAVLVGVTLDGARFDAAKLDDAILMGANGQGSSFAQADLKGANLTSADLTDATLDGANLSQVAADQTVFNGSSLAAAIFTQSNLTGAVLSKAKAPKADFGAATLIGAACDHADFTEATFHAADVTETSFSASKLNGANFEGAKAADADFSNAELVGASFRGANCEGMWLSSAKADRANFTGAVCIDMQLDATSAKQANFAECNIASIRGGERADLSGANFRGTHGIEPTFESCRLDGADFSLTDIPGANFIHATAVGTNFTAAELKGARFDYADCSDAVFATANLFEANFAGVTLSGADLSEANFYGVDFLDARIKDLRLSGCNLNMTKLEQWAATNNR